MSKVTATEFQKAFSFFRVQAHKAAVIITNHGKDDLAVISAEEYERLRALDQKPFYIHELPDHIYEGLGREPIPEEARQFNDEYQPG